MSDWKRKGAAIAVVTAVALVSAALLPGCGEDTVGPGGGGEPPPVATGPFALTQIYLRPLSIQRPPNTGGRPTPALAEYALSGFYRGGTELASFEWTFPPAIGTVEPKTVYLDRADATVVIRNDGNPPLGFFDVEAHAQSGTETGNLKQRFAVVENRWMKHQRNYFTGTEPEDLAQWPVFLTRPGTPASADSILYVIDSGSSRRIYRFPAFANLNGEEPRPTTIMITPIYADPSNAQSAPSTQPDVAPSALGRREILFSSRIDPQYSIRCPRQPCENTAPLRLWVVRVPDGLTEFLPRVLTADTTYIGAGGQARWIAYQYTMPKWDPKATGPRARIAYLSDQAEDPTAARSTNLWLGDLVDSNGDAHSDSLVNRRKMTTSGGIASYAWHPDGTRICLADPQGLAWMDVGSGVTTRIGLPDSLVLRPAYPTVFHRPGEHTLVAFQGQAENLRNLFVWDEDDNTLTRVLPFPIPVNHNLFPRWHPTRKVLVYICDYTVRAWANSSSGPGTPPDRINPSLDPYYSVSRTLYPSPWVVSFED